MFGTWNMVLRFFFHVSTASIFVGFGYMSCVPWDNVRQSSSFKHFKLYQFIMSDHSLNFLNIPLSIVSPNQPNVDFEHPAYLQKNEQKESIEEQDLQASKLDEDQYSSYRQFQNEMKKSVYYSSPQFSQHSRRKESSDSFKVSPQFKMKAKPLEHDVIPEEDNGKIKLWKSSLLNTVIFVVKSLNLKQILRFKTLEHFQIKLIKDQSSSYKQLSQMGYLAKRQKSLLNSFLNQKILDEDDSLIWSAVVTVFYLFSFFYLTFDLITMTDTFIIYFQIFFPILEAIQYLNTQQNNMGQLHDQRVNIIKLYYKQCFYFDFLYILIIIFRIALGVKILSLFVFIRFNRFISSFNTLIDYLDISGSYIQFQVIIKTLFFIVLINFVFTSLKINLDDSQFQTIDQFLDYFYITLLEFALVQSNISNDSSIQKVLSILIVLTSFSVSLYILQMVFASSQRKKKQKNLLKSFQQQGLSKGLLWKLKKNGKLNQKLQNQIQWELYGQAFEDSQILKNLCNQKLKKELSSKLWQQFYDQDQIIAKKGDACRYLYYIQQGTVVVTLNNSTILLQKGEFLEELGFIQDKKFEFDYVAQGKCTLLVLDTDDFNKIIKNDQETFEQMHMIKVPDFDKQKCLICRQQGHGIQRCNKIFYIHDICKTISKHRFSIEQLRKAHFRGSQLSINEKKNKQRIFQSALFFAIQEAFLKEEELTNHIMNMLQGNIYEQNQIDQLFTEDEKSKFSSLMEKQQTEFGIQQSVNSPQTSSNKKSNTQPIPPLRLESDKESSNSKPGTNFMMSQKEKYSSSISSIKLNYYKSSFSSDQILGSSRKMQLGKNSASQNPQMKKMNTTFSKIDEIDFPNSNESYVSFASYLSYFDEMHIYQYYFPNFNFDQIQKKLSEISFLERIVNYYTVGQRQNEEEMNYSIN